MNARRISSAEFSGQLLARGYWIYVWRIRYRSKHLFYVGRTGDSSSVNAASPFSRLSRHLESRANSKSNSLYRALQRHGLKPELAKYEMLAFGPLYPETKDKAKHRDRRDAIAAIEYALAEDLKQSGFTVIGYHQKSRAQIDKSTKSTFLKILRTVKQRYS